jgi:uncharacterized membrane protein
MPRIVGRVIEKWSGVPVVNAVVNIGGSTYLTNNNGYFDAEVQAGNVSITAMHKNYETESALAALTEGAEIIIELKPIVGAL